VSPPITLQLALAAHGAGLCPVPPREDGSKQPITELVTRAGLTERLGVERAAAVLGDKDEKHTWKHWQFERPSVATLTGWFQGGRSGLGTLTGGISDSLELFEFDERATYEAFRGGRRPSV
jgi:hypothetical protein